MARIDETAPNTLITRIKGFLEVVQQLKVGVQYIEAKMYEAKSASAYDLTGSMGSAGSNIALAAISVVATSTDGITPIQGLCAPQIWIPNPTTVFEDTGLSDYRVTVGQRPSSDGLSIEFWYLIATRNSVAAAAFFFKYNVYTTAQVSVSISRTL
jgi:hypothetical protein